MDAVIKPLHWVGSSRSDLRNCPDGVKDEVGYALHVAQEGGKHQSAKVLHGFGGAGVLEIVANDDGNTIALSTPSSLPRPFMCSMSS